MNGRWSHGLSAKEESRVLVLCFVCFVQTGKEGEEGEGMRKEEKNGYNLGW